MTTFVNLPLQNQCDNLNLTWDKAFSGEGDSVVQMKGHASF